MANDQKRKWNTAGGVGVILVTGLFAIGDGSFFDGSAVNTILGVLVLVLTIGGAIALVRFVSRHGDEIWGSALRYSQQGRQASLSRGF